MNGSITAGQQTVSSDKVAVSGWVFRGSGGSSPIYGGSFGVSFNVSGVAANGIEIDVENNWSDRGAADAAGGRGLWVNGSGSVNRHSAVYIDTQNSSRWWNGIYYSPNTIKDASAGGAGIFFDGSQSNGFITMRPSDDSGGVAIKLTDAAFSVSKFEVHKDGTVDSATGYTVGGLAGVSCPAGTINGATVTVVGGIVTHC